MNVSDTASLAPDGADCASRLTEMQDLETYAERLDASGCYRVLRKLRRRPVVHRLPTPSERVAIIIDTETTGLDLKKDEVIELAMIAFTYDQDGRIGDVIGAFEGLREPRVPLHPDVSKLTGITSEMLKGRRLEGPTVEDFVRPAALIIAHNAAFDRPMCEKLSSIFSIKPWACSATEVEWRRWGFEGVKLAYLLTQSGIFHTGHRALDDCFGLLEVLASDLPEANGTAFQKLLESARQSRFRIWTTGSYDMRQTLKGRGYRWNPGGEGIPRTWWIEVPENRTRTEIAFLKSQPRQTRPRFEVERVTAFNRFRQTGPRSWA